MRAADDRAIKVLPDDILVVVENAHWLPAKIKDELSRPRRQCALALVLHDVGREIPEALDESIQRRPGTMKTRHHVVAILSDRGSRLTTPPTIHNAGGWAIRTLARN